MSFSYSFLAAQCQRSELQAAMLAAWPALELAEPPQEFPTWKDAYQWATPRSGYLTGKHPHDVKLIHQDGSWSVIADISMVMASDEDCLAELSRRVGRLIVATTQGTVGHAQLQVFDAGAAIRSITGDDGNVTQTGAPISEEEGVALQNFYLDELDAIWRRFGLSSFLSADPRGPAIALHVVDRTEIDEIVPLSTRPPVAQPKAWWRLW